MIRRHLARLDVPSEVRFALDDELVGAIVADNSRVIEANDHFLRTVGYAQDDVTSGALSWLRMTDPAWLAVDARAIGQVRATGQAEAFDKEYIRADGSRVPVRLACLLLEVEPLRIMAFVAPLDDDEALRLIALVDAARPA